MEEVDNISLKAALENLDRKLKHWSSVPSRESQGQCKEPMANEELEGLDPSKGNDGITLSISKRPLNAIKLKFELEIPRKNGNKVSDREEQCKKDLTLRKKHSSMTKAKRSKITADVAVFTVCIMFLVLCFLLWKVYKIVYNIQEQIEASLENDDTGDNFDDSLDNYFQEECDL